MRDQKRLLTVAAAGAILAAGLRSKLRRYAVAESSMEPELRPGDFIIAKARCGNVRRGDIVIIPHPGITGFELVKRVIGLPGETIVLRAGRVHVDGSPLTEPWADGPARPDGEWKLGPDQVFVLGDNRPRSAADSRTIGPLEVSTAGWTVVARYWPPASIGRIATRAYRP